MTKTVRLIPYLLLSVFFLLLTGTRMAAQDSPVTIHLQSLKKEPLPFASVTVINRLDSSQVIRQVADSNGTSRFMLVKGQQYIVRVNALNYLPFEKNISATANTPAFRFTLETAGKTMEGVVLRSTRPLIRQEDDKTIVDPENLR